MADFWSNDDRGYKLKVTLDTVSQNVNNNSSQVRIRAWLLNGGWTFTGYQVTASVTVDGQTANYSGSPAMLSQNSSIQLIDKTITITHGDDGSKVASMTARLQGGGGYSPNTLSIGRQGYQLAAIARASSATVPNGVIGSAMTITIQPVKAGYTHTVRYEFESRSGTIASNVATSANWTPPMELCDLYPNSTTGTGQIHVDTYSGGRKLGTRSFSTTLTIPDSVKPTLSNFSLLEGSDVVKRVLPNGPFVQVLSQIKVNFGVAQGARGSTIKNYKAVILGSNQTVTENNGTFGIIDRSGEITVRASVVDSRGRESPAVDKKVRVEAYHAPILSFSVERAGALQDNLLINRNAKVASLGNKNRMKLRFYAARGLSPNYTAANGPAAGEWTTQFEFVNSRAALSGSYSGTSSWMIKGVLEDVFTSTEFVFSVPTEQVVLSYTPHGVGIKKPWERGAVDARGDVYVEGNIYVNNRMIQHYPLTSKDGRSPYNASKTVDLNLRTINSFFSVNEPKNGPLGDFVGQFYVAVYSESDRYLSQDLIEKATGRRFTRTRHNGDWTPWKQLAFKEAKEPAKTSSQQLNLFWGVKATAVRKGDTVTLSINRAIYNINSSAEYRAVTEKIPAGYRPISESHLIMYANSGASLAGTSVAHIASDGSLKLTNNVLGGKVWTGTVTYLTNDPHP